MSEENSMDVPECESSTSAVKTPTTKRATGRARHGQRARKCVTVIKDDDEEEQSTSAPGCGWERIYQNQPGKPEEYLGALDEDMVLNIASDCLSTLKLINEKQRNSSKGAAPFGPKKELEKKAGSSTPKMDKKAGSSTPKMDKKAGSSTVKIDKKAGSSIPKVDTPSKKKSKKRTVIESRSPSPRPRTPNCDRTGNESDGDIFIDDLFSTDSEAEAKKVKEQEEKAIEERRKEKEERRKEKEEKKKAKEERRREKEERRLEKERKLEDEERLSKQCAKASREKEHQSPAKEVTRKLDEMITVEPSLVKESQKETPVIEAVPSTSKDDCAKLEAVMTEDNRQNEEASASLEVSSESLPVVTSASCESTQTNEPAASLADKEDNNAVNEVASQEADIDKSSSAALEVRQPSPKDKSVDAPVNGEVDECMDAEKTAGCTTMSSGNTGVLSKFHVDLVTVEVPHFKEQSMEMARLCEANGDDMDGTKATEKTTTNSLADIRSQYNVGFVRIVVPLLYEEHITKLRSSAPEPKARKEEKKVEKTAKRTKKEDRIPRKRPGSPSIIIKNKMQKDRSESPPARFLQSSEPKSSKRIVLSESPPQSPKKSVEQPTPILNDGYESDSPEGDTMQPQRKIPQKKVIEDRTCFTCKRHLMECEEDWCDLLGSNSGYCSVQCIDDRVAHLFRAIGDPEFKVMLISTDNLVMPEGLALHQLGAFLRESPQYDIITPDKSRLPKKDATMESKASKHLSKDSDALRFSYKKSMIDALTNRVSKSGSGKTFRVKDCKDIAEKLEISLFKHCKLNVMNPRYKLWVKHFNTQVKDMKNKGFYHRVLCGELSVHFVTSIDPEKLADPQYSALSDGQKKVDIPGLGDGTAKNRIPLRKPVATTTPQATSSTLDALLGDGSDTTEQHQSHMFDANCRICCNNQKSAAVAEKKDQEERLKAKDDERKRKELRKTLVGVDEEDSHKGSRRNRGVDDVFMLDRKDPLNLNKPSFDSPRYASDDEFAGGADDDDYQAPVSTNRDEDDGSKTPDSVGEIWAKRARAREESWRSSPKDKSASAKSQKESPWERPDIWRGNISMSSFAFVTTMTAVSNTAAFEIRDNNELPAVIRVKGRISPVIVFDYLTELRTDFSKDVIVVRLERPVDPEEEKKFMTFFDDMTRKDRHLVVDLSDHQTIKDAYLMAVPTSKEAPAPLLPWRGPGISVDHSDMIIGVFVRYKRQLLDIPLQSITEPSKETKGPSDEPESTSTEAPTIAPYNGPAPGLSALSATNISNLTSFVSKIIAARNTEPATSGENLIAPASQHNAAAVSLPSTSGVVPAPIAASFIQPAAQGNDTLIPTQYLNLFQQNREREAAQISTPTKMPTIHPNDIHTLADLIMFIQSSTGGPKIIKGVVARFIQNPMLTEQDKAVIRKKVFEKIQAEKMKKLSQAPHGGQNSPCVSVTDSERMAPTGVPPPPTGSGASQYGQPHFMNRPVPLPQTEENHEQRDFDEEHRSFTPSDFDNCDRPLSFLDRADDLVEKLASSLQKSQAGLPVVEPQNVDEGQDETMSDQADAGSSTANSRSNTPLVLTIASTPNVSERPPEPPRDSESEPAVIPKPPPPVPLASIPPPPAAMSRIPPSAVPNIPPPPTAPVPKPMQGAQITPSKIPPPPQRAVPLPLPKHLIPPAAPVLPYITVVNAPPGPPPSIPPPPSGSLASSIAGPPPPPPSFGQPLPSNYTNGMHTNAPSDPVHYPEVTPSIPTGIPVIGAPPVPPPFSVAPPPPPPVIRESRGCAGFGGLAPSLGGGKVEKYSMIDFYNKNTGIRSDVIPIPLELAPAVPDDGFMPGFGNSNHFYDPRYADDNVPRTPTPTGSDEESDSPPEKILFGGMLCGRRPGTNRLVFPGARVFLRPPSPDADELTMVQREERRRLKDIERRIKKAEETWKLEERRLRREKRDREREDEREKELQRIQEERKQNRARRESMEAYWQKMADRKKKREEREKAFPETVRKLGLGKLRKTCTEVAKNYRIRMVAESDGISFEDAAKIVEEHHIVKTDEECTTDSEEDTGVPSKIRRRARGGRKARERREAASAGADDDFDYSREGETASEMEERRQRIAFDRTRGHTTSSIKITRMTRALNVEEDDRFPDEVYDYDRDGYGYNGESRSPRGISEEQVFKAKPYNGCDQRSLNAHRRSGSYSENISRSTSAAPAGIDVVHQDSAHRPTEDMEMATSGDERSAAPPAQKAPYNTFTEMPTTAKKAQSETIPNAPKPNAPYMQYNNPTNITPTANERRDGNYDHQRGGGPAKDSWKRDAPMAPLEPDWSQYRGGDSWCDQRRDMPCREYEGGYNDYDSFNDEYQRLPPPTKRGRGRGATQVPRGGRGAAQTPRGGRGKGDTPARGGRKGDTPARGGRGRGRGTYNGPVAYDQTPAPSFFGGPGPAAPYRPEVDHGGYGTHGYADDYHGYADDYHGYDDGYGQYGSGYGPDDGYYGSGYGMPGHGGYSAPPRNPAPAYSQHYDQPFNGYNASLAADLPPRNLGGHGGYGYGQPVAAAPAPIPAVQQHPYATPAPKTSSSNSLLMQPPPPPPPPPTIQHY